MAVFIGAYCLWCVLGGVMAGVQVTAPKDFFIASRRMSATTYIAAVTAASFSAWAFLGHSGIIFRDGFQFAYTSLYPIAIALTGVLFFKRQWMLSRRFGFMTSGEMFAEYFNGGMVRFLAIIIGLTFAIPYVGIQLGASGLVFNVLSDDALSPDGAMWMLSAIVALYVMLGGMRAVSYAGVLQWALMIFVLVTSGYLLLQYFGGWSTFTEGLAQLGRQDGVGRWGSTADGYSAYFVMPSAMDLTAGLGKETPVGGIWTGTMCLTYVLGMMGIQATPAFSAFAFSASSPRSFGWQQVVFCALIMGGLLVFVSVAQGVGAHLLGANPAIDKSNLGIAEILTPRAGERPEYLVTEYLRTLNDTMPWLVGLMAVAFFAAIHSTGAAMMNAAGAMMARDVYKRYVHRSASHGSQIFVARMSILLIMLAALTLSTFFKPAILLLGGVAIAWGFQLLPALAAVCWFPWLTRTGVTLGLIAGMIGVVLTDGTGAVVAGWFDQTLPWGRWPLTIYSAAWGMFANITIAVVVSALTQTTEATTHRQRFHSFLSDHSEVPVYKRGWITIAWVIAILWMIFGIGPGAIVGNTIFGAPASGLDGWAFGIPSIWAWQILWWGVGVVMLAIVAFYLEFSRAPHRRIDPLVDDLGDIGR